MKTQHKAFSADVKISSEDERCVRAVISSSAVDREGDVLIPQGMNSKDFEANPVVMLMHSYYTLPIGKVTAIKRGEETVEAKIEFAARPDDHPEGEEWVPATIFSLFKQGVLNAFSVGFIPTDARAATSRDCTKYGEECQQVINRWKLLELSVVGLPCNQEAVAMAVSKGFAPEHMEKLFGGEVAAVSPEDAAAALATGKVSEAGNVSEKVVPIDVANGNLVPDDAAEEIVESLAAVKEITREVTPATRVTRLVDADAAPAPAVKHVHRFIEPPQPDVAVKTHKVVVRTLSKLRGRVWVDE